MIVFKVFMLLQIIGLSVAIYGAVVYGRCFAGRPSLVDKVAIGFLASIVLSLAAIIFTL